MAETLIFSTGSRIISGTLTSTASISQLNLDGVSGSFSGTFIGDGSGVSGIVSASHALQADNATSASHALQADNAKAAATASLADTASLLLGSIESASFADSASHAIRANIADVADVADSGTGSFTGTFIGDFTGSTSFTGSFTGGLDGTATSASFAETASFASNAISNTGSFTGSLTGAVRVLSDPWTRTTGSAAGPFNANSFSLTELSARFAGLVDELLVFVPLPLSLPQQGSLTLYYDATQQGDTSIIQETINGRDAAASSGTFTFRTGPPSVDLFIGLNATNNGLPISLMHNSDGIMTMMVLLKPELITAPRTVISHGGRTKLLLGTPSSSHWAFDMSETSGDDPATGTQIPATQSVWQTICYTVDVDGASKQNGYFNGALALGPLSKSFDVAQFSLTMGIGNSSYSGSFGAYLQWTTTLTAEEVVQAHNFLRNIDVGYGLPEA